MGSFLQSEFTASTAWKRTSMRGSRGGESGSGVWRMNWRTAFSRSLINCATCTRAAPASTAAKITVIHNGVDRQRFFPDPRARVRVRQEFGIAEDEFCIGCVGNFFPVKGPHHRARRRSKRVSHACPNWRLLLIGEGPERSKLESFVAAHPGWKQARLFPGTSDRVPELLERDGRLRSAFGGGRHLEFAAGGDGDRPSGDRHETGGNPEVVVDGESGLLFPVGDARRWRTTCSRSSRSTTIAGALGERALRRVAKSSRSNRWSRKYAQLYEGLGRRPRLRCMPRPEFKIYVWHLRHFRTRRRSDRPALHAEGDGRHAFATGARTTTVSIRCGGVGLAHRRLSIIDLAGGHQPLSNEDESDLDCLQRRDLQLRGAEPAVSVDGPSLSERAPIRRPSSTFTRSWAKPASPKCAACSPSRCGTAAASGWCWPATGSARSRCYYSWDGRRLVFGSEIKALWKAGGLSKEMDLEALSDYFSYLYVPAPKTIYRERAQAAAGALPGGGRIRNPRGRRIGISASTRRASFPKPNGASEFLAEYRTAVKSRLVSDVPLGAFLSGGVDSSSVVALMNEFQPPVTTCSIGFSRESVRRSGRRAAVRGDAWARITSNRSWSRMRSTWCRSWRGTTTSRSRILRRCPLTTFRRWRGST